MKLKTFEKPNTVKAARLSPIAIFSISKANQMMFNRVACELLCLKSDEYIEFLNDTETPCDWYIRLTDASNTNGFKLREVKGGGTTISNAALALAIRETTKCGEEAVRFRMATQPDETYNVYAILTAVNLNKK